MMDSKEFLNKLLSTPSPSGGEVNIQQIWKEYITPFTDSIYSDNIGNVVGVVNPNASFKVMLTSHIDEIGFIITHIEQSGTLRFNCVGGMSPKHALGKKIQVLGKNISLVGVIGTPAVHHNTDDDNLTFSDLFIDCGAENQAEIKKHIRIGDYAVYKSNPEYLLNNTISSRGLDNRIGAFIISQVLQNVYSKGLEIGLYCVSTVNEESNKGGAYFAASQIAPNLSIVCDATFATDYENTNKNIYSDISIGKGPVLSKGSTINKKINELLEKVSFDNNIHLQYNTVPRYTKTDADRIRLTGNGVPIALVSYPLRYMHSPSELVSLNDVMNAIELICEFLLNLTGKEVLDPLKI